MNRMLHRALTTVAATGLLLVPAGIAHADGNPPEVECDGLEFLTKFEGNDLDFVTASVGVTADKDGVVITVSTIDDPDNNGVGSVVDLAWTSQTPVDRIVVKAGQDSNVHELDEAENGVVAAGADKDISHITFCFDEGDEPADEPGDEPGDEPEDEPQPQPEPEDEPEDEPEVLGTVIEQPDTLPQTGAASTLMQLLAGLGLVGTGGALVRTGRRTAA